MWAWDGTSSRCSQDQRSQAWGCSQGRQESPGFALPAILSFCLRKGLGRVDADCFAVVPRAARFRRNRRAIGCLRLCPGAQSWDPQVCRGAASEVSQLRAACWLRMDIGPQTRICALEGWNLLSQAEVDIELLLPPSAWQQAGSRRGGLGRQEGDLPQALGWPLCAPSLSEGLSLPIHPTWVRP
jgi:hypothetical protein